MRRRRMKKMREQIATLTASTQELTVQRDEAIATRNAVTGTLFYAATVRSY